jgi:tRNA isopentenyl-2-thiomethyl-A-37 hydroxylase MiaE
MMFIDMTDEQVRQIIRDELSTLIKSDRFTFEKLIQILDGRNIQLGLINGTKIGTATSQLLGFYNKTPVDQPATVADADGTLADATTKINTIIDRLQELGLIA